MDQKRILVTGISGFIAKHCAAELLAHGYAVRGTVRNLARQSEVRAVLDRHADAGRLDFAAADLESDAGWDDAMAGCDGVLHLASPFPSAPPKNPDDLIRPAVQGTLRVLAAARRGEIPRFVQTSSVAAIISGHPRSRTAPFTEDDWTLVDAPHVAAYDRSKTLAERAARDFVREDAPDMHFSTVNPGFVLGPALDREIGTSLDLIRMLLSGKYPGVPRLQLPIVDVRDVAKMHRLALETDRPSGGRYMSADRSLWLVDIVRAINAGLGPKASKVPSRQLPDFLVRLVALVDKTARLSLPDLGRPVPVDSSRTRRELGMDFIRAEEAAVASAESLVALGLV